MRGLLIVNPVATSTTDLTRDVIAHAFVGLGDMEVVTTTHPGHAHALAARARRDGLDLVVTMGGDGTAHEAINGLLTAEGPGDPPAFAPISGGSANVLPRALGLPRDPVESAGSILAAIESDRRRRIGLGRVNGRWFATSVGFGLDAEVVAAVEERRRQGHRATPGLYVRAALGQYFRHTDRRTPALTIAAEGQDPVAGIYLAVVQNTAPWTYMGRIPVSPCPTASFDSGLDLWAVSDLRVLPSLRWAGRILRESRAGDPRRGLTTRHDLRRLTVTADRAVALQVDGEALGTVRYATMESVPDALTTFA